MFVFNTDEYADGRISGFPAKTRRCLAEDLGLTVTADSFTVIGGGLATARYKCVIGLFRLDDTCRL